jgi:hypothetical protein
MTGHIVASAVNVAARLNIADHLADGPRATADLARELHVDEDARSFEPASGAGVYPP